MKLQALAVIVVASAAPVVAQEHREMDAHVHGVSSLEIAVEGDVVEMSLYAPGMDIVGFEHAPTSDGDKAAVAAALVSLNVPGGVMALPDDAGCSVTAASAELDTGDETEDNHHEHGEDHPHDDHDHDHDHDDHSHGEDHASHSEFHASYAFACEHPEALNLIEFPFFDSFPNAQKIEAQFVTDAGAGSAEVTRAAPRLSLN